MAGMAPSSSLHDRTSEILGRLRKLDQRLSYVTVRILGNVPETAQDTPKPIEEYLVDKFDGIVRVINSIEEEMLRLENGIGVAEGNKPKQALASGY